jgi:hypothetical protein
LRLGLVLTEGREAEMARLAEGHGLFGVLAGFANPLTAITGAVYASTATDFVRVVARVQLGLEHPVAIAEELAVLDNVNNGRTVILADTGERAAGDASDEVAVLCEALGNRPVHHDGPKWKVPAGLPANATAPKSIAVTPKPAQLEIPFWLTGARAAEVSESSRLPILARAPSSVSDPGWVQPAIARISGDLKQDREAVSEWAATGVTHLLIELPQGGDHAELVTLLSRHLAPEVGMPQFPRVMSQSRVPLPWPGDGPPQH